MDRAEIQTLLKEYKENSARAAHIRTQTDELSARLALLKARLVYDETGPGAQNITDMPRGTNIGDPTAEVAIRLASGYETDEMKSIRAKMDELTIELKGLEIKIAYVDAWMKCLNVYERWLMDKQAFDETHWRELEDVYKKDFGYWTSYSSLKRMRNAAIDKICRIAR